MRKRTYSYFLLMGSLLALMGLYVMLAGTLPFGGYRIHGYSSIPPVVCPGATLQLEADVEFRPPRYATLGDYRLVTYWSNPKGGRTEVETFTGSFRDSARGRRVVLSPVLRTAPQTAGAWRLVSVVTYKGKVLGWERNAETPFSTPEPVLETLAPDSPRCLPPEE